MYTVIGEQAEFNPVTITTRRNITYYIQLQLHCHINNYMTKTGIL